MRLINYIKSMRWQHVFAALLLVWLGQNLASAMLVEVMSDEAYYWLWGRHLAWGYYDHPPVVAAMTCISSMLFEGNLSVRFFSIISQTLTLVIIWLLVGEKQPSVRRVLLFFAIAASMIMFAAYGFVAAPDVGLLLFAALFLFFYQKYLVRSTWMAALGMGIAMAAMLYSKYHGFLVIAFVVLSNPKLLLQRRVWFAAVLAALLFMPHIAWQAAHGFPSLQYHTAGRSSAFRMAYLLEYLPNQLVVFNPFVVGAIVLILVKYRRVKDAFVRSLHYLTTGIIIFFWVMCIRGHVEPHWTVVCSIPMIILLYRHSMENVRMLNYVKRFVLPSILIVLIARILLTTQALPQRLGFWGKAARFSALYHAVSDNRQQTTDNRQQTTEGSMPVVFTGSFQNAGNYSFFGRGYGFVLSGVNSRLTQWDVWQWDLAAQGREVFVMGAKDDGRSQEYAADGYAFYGYVVKSFQSVNRVKISYTLLNNDVAAGDTLDIALTMSNPDAYAIDFKHAELPVSVLAAYGRRRDCVFAPCIYSDSILLAGGGSVSVRLRTVVPDLPHGGYRFCLSLGNAICAARNSNFAEVMVK